jgi:Flp pilus assembly protein protease CpaA
MTTLALEIGIALIVGVLLGDGSARLGAWLVARLGGDQVGRGPARVARTRLPLVVLAVALALDAPNVRASAAELIAVALLVAAADVDVALLIFPNVLLAAAGLAAVAASVMRGVPLSTTAEGAAAGFGVVVGLRALQGAKGMGLGDAKFLAIAGVLVGWFNVLCMLLATAVLGLLWVAVRRGAPPVPRAVTRELEVLRELAARGEKKAAEILARDPLGESPETAIPTGPLYVVALVGCELWRVAR